MEAVAMFAAGRGSGEVAKELGVSVRSVQRWRQAWRAAGRDGVRSRGPASRPKLSETLFAVLEEELAKGPVAHGWPDQRWTLARIKTLIGRRFHESMTLSGISRAPPRCFHRGFLAAPLFGQEQVGGGDEGDVAVPSDE
ncbi:Transposase OS=Streptomyces lavendulae subsp. lavendulae OX=58340 GN=SLAV_00820 PE=4 SV=1 [Streptomyces lavendulae subsp. lavendulae]